MNAHNAEAKGVILEIPLPRLDELAVFTPDGGLLGRNMVIGFDSRDSRARPFNLLRTQFAKRMARDNAKLVGVTSAAPDAGKSFMCLNLAAALSRVTNQTIYLVDLDLRRASIAAQLGLEVELGVSDFLSGKTNDLGALGLQVEGTRLAIYPTRAVGEESAELLSGDRFIALIRAMRQNSDDAIILFDLPPVFANDDAMIVVDQIDGYIMVVDAGRSTKRQVQETMLMLQPTPCIGAVLNRYTGGIIDDYGYSYGYHASGRYDP